MQRRSTARATPRKKYTVDAFEGIPELEAAADSDEVELEGDEFEHVDDEDELIDDEDELVDDEVERVDEEDDLGLESDAHDEQALKPARPAKPLKKPDRGGVEIDEARRRWANDLALPTRDKDSNGSGGFRCSLSQSEEARKVEARHEWSWYRSNGGKEAFQSHQRLDLLSAEAVGSYLGDQRDRSFVMGPYTDQKLFHLGVGQSMPLTNAWDVPTGDTDSTAKPEPALRYKPGFILNLGAKVRCLEWVPGQDNKVQYLTTVVSQERGAVDSMDTSASPDSRPPKQSHVCIWRFQADAECYIDTTATPTLKLVLCIDWGAIRSLKWCPTAWPDADSLGLLALIAEDGKLRVLDVPLPSTDDSVAYALAKQVAFELQSPGTVCTCIAWLSPTRISAGCANGSVHFWDLEEILSTNDPGLSLAASKSYITSITSCGPSHPHMLFMLSAGGELSVADISKLPPQVSPLTANPQVNVLSQPLLLWHDYSQRALTTDDDCEIFARSLHKGKHKIAVGKARSITMATAGSPCHPCILVGTAGGEVFATNPLIKVTNGKADIWQQTWFAHEWRRQTAVEKTAAEQETAGSNDQIDDASITIGKNGLSRILEGFKPERIPPDGKGKASVIGGTNAYTIFEEKTAVTALAWNPNIGCGGWAAAGMAGGLVRVEDIAV